MLELSKVKGWGSAKVKELKEKGFDSIEEVLVVPPPQYAEIMGVDNETAREHHTKCQDAYDLERERKTFRTGNECKIEDDNKIRITTGSKALDKLFQGGIEFGSTTEVYAEFGSGKTQLCHTMAVRVQTEQKKKCIWLNTEGTFEPSRITAICKGMEIDPEEILDGILVADALNSVEQHRILFEISKLLAKDDSYGLIIIDSATGLFRGDYSGRGQLSERQKYLDQFLTHCSNVATLYNVAVIWTNQVYKNPSIFYGDPTVAVGGTIIEHKSTYRVYIMKSGKFRIAKMVDSPKDAQTEVMFGLSSLGVVDMDVAVEEEKERKKELTKAKTEAKKGKVDTEEEEE